MIDETDVSQEKAWFYEQRARTVIKNLQKGNINAQYVPGRREALSVVMEMIPPGAVVARGDSISVEQIGIIPELVKRNQNRIIDPLERDAEGFYAVAEPEERRRIAREVFSADIYLVGSNAITLDGKLVNVDGWGNRVSAMIFGPRKVIFVVGANKITRDVNAALERIHHIAAPMNARRHYLKHHREDFSDLPCVRTGNCVDCSHGSRICRYTVIIDVTQLPDKGRINVVLVGEELGI